MPKSKITQDAKEALEIQLKPACPFCNSQDCSYIRDICAPHGEVAYPLWECHFCLSRFFDWQKAEFDPIAFYQTNLDFGCEPEACQFSSYWAHEVRIIRRLLNRWPSSVLDIGCRTGDFLLHWPETVRRCGVELSATNARIAESRGVDVVCGSVERVSLSGAYDVVTCYAILEHLMEPKGFLETIMRRVAPGGLVVILTPNHQTLKAQFLERIRARWHMYCPPEHLTFVSATFLDQYMETLGFSLARRRYTSGGMVNPFSRLVIIRTLWAQLMWLLDTRTCLSRFPVFDHMYSYYRKAGNE